jgi:hypothetical protein
MNGDFTYVCKLCGKMCDLRFSSEAGLSLPYCCEDGYLDWHQALRVKDGGDAEEYVPIKNNQRRFQ